MTSLRLDLSNALLIGTLIMGTALVGCGTSDPATSTAGSPSVVVGSSGQASYNNAHSIDELVDKSEVVAVVLVDRKVESRQIEGRTADGRLDPRFSSVVGIYDVTVEEFLKGSAPTAFRFVQSEQTIFDNPDRSEELRRESVFVNPQESPEPGSRYMLFLRPYSRVENAYVTTFVEPAFWVLDKGTAAPESPSDFAEARFEVRSESELRAQVINAVAVN